MRLTRIEINGFKSFAKKQELVFSDGITAVIGPNGCGKSNISDAFRFVLGEQSARVLRGKKIEDFIFSGTAKRRPLSFCEVSIHFDNSDSELQTPFSEVCITRRAFRSGESEYYINGSSCRLRDIHELFRDTGIGKDGYSIIGQGKVADILSDKSSDRRSAFEEAAGVAKYRSRKEDAERKLQNTQKNLVRLEDILSELEGRIEPLREQSEKATEYFKLREELRIIEINLFINQYEKSGERIGQLTDTVSQLTEHIVSEETVEATLVLACTEAESLERSLSVSIGDTSQRLLSATAGVEELLGEEKVIKERLASLDKERVRLETLHNNSDLLYEEYLKNMDMLATEQSVASSNVDELNDRISLIEERLNKSLSAIEAKESDIDRHKQSMMDAMNRLSDVKGTVSRLDEMRNALLRRIDAINKELEGVTSEESKLSEEELECIQAEESIKSDIAKLEANRSVLIAKSNEISEKILIEKQHERQLEKEKEAVISRRRVLLEMKLAHEGYHSSVRDLLRDASTNAELSLSIEGVVAELISVPARYETAIEMSLGASLQNIVVPTQQDGKKVIEYLRRKNYGRATVLPVTAMRSRLLSSEERLYLDVEGCFGVASELISFSEQHRNVMESLLGRTVIVRDLDVGIAINKYSRNSFRIATLKGDIMNQGGSMTGGSVQKKEFSLLGRERELEQLSDKSAGINDQLNICSKNIHALTHTLEDINSNISALSAKTRSLDISLATQSEKHDIIRKYIEKNKAQIRKLDFELSQINDNLFDIDEQYKQAVEIQSGISSGNASTGADIHRMQSELTCLKNQHQLLNDELIAIKVKHMAAKKELLAIENEISRIKRELSRNKYQAAESSKLLEINCTDIDASKRALEDIEYRIHNGRDTVNRLTDDLRQLESERSDKLICIDELRKRREDCSLKLSEMRERSHRSELTLNRLRLELDGLCSRIWQDYEITYENALPYRRQLSSSASHIRADEIRNALRALGEVNTAAIEDYKNITDRYSQLKEQCADLKQAELDLSEIINRLTGTMENEFKERFKLIQENFGLTFSELFHGGKAELALSDKNDVLNCDIEIHAQPPGKRLQLLSLLSGGEQALTAIALLFAILKLKPTAFCILDEIDTSLDEANVDNLAEYLQTYCAETQFIIITHRKGCMAVCNSMYGVSMEEKGVSTLISARFDENNTNIV